MPDAELEELLPKADGHLALAVAHAEPVLEPDELDELDEPANLISEHFSGPKLLSAVACSS